MILGDIIFGEAIFGSPLGGEATDTPITIVIVNDVSGRITYLSKSGVKIISENSSVYIFNEEPSWVRT